MRIRQNHRLWIRENIPISVHTTEQLRLEVHVVETTPLVSMNLLCIPGHYHSLVDDLVPVGLNLPLGDVLELVFSIPELCERASWPLVTTGTHADMLG